MTDKRRSRLRFDGFQLERFHDGRCQASVQLEWTRGRRFEGESDGTQTLEGEIRAAAMATLGPVSEATGNRLAFQLMGAKAFRAFDSWIVVVSLSANSESETRRLMGSYPCPDDNTARGAVMAVLDATNRIMEWYLED